MSEDRYVSRKEVSKSYRPRSYVMSPGLLRARAPFRLQNAITGVVLFGFATAVWAYSIRAVKQDDFSDVDEEAREMMRSRQAMLGSSSSVVDKDGDAGLGVIGAAVATASRASSSSTPSSDASSTTRVSPPRGILAPVLDRTFPNLLDPTRKTLVWGAPPVDDLGRVSLQGSAGQRR